MVCYDVVSDRIKVSFPMAKTRRVCAPKFMVPRFEVHRTKGAMSTLPLLSPGHEYILVADVQDILLGQGGEIYTKLMYFGDILRPHHLSIVVEVPWK